MSNLSTKAPWVKTASSVRALGYHNAVYDSVPALFISQRNGKSCMALWTNH